MPAGRSAKRDVEQQAVQTVRAAGSAARRASGDLASSARSILRRLVPRGPPSTCQVVDAGDSLRSQSVPPRRDVREVPRRRRAEQLAIRDLRSFLPRRQWASAVGTARLA